MNAKQKKIRELAGRYVRLIEWSNEDGCYVGSAPPLIGMSCHGETTADVARQLDEIVLDLCEDIADGKMVAPDFERKQFSGQFVVRISPSLHKKTALKAAARGESLNQFVAEALAKA